MCAMKVKLVTDYRDYYDHWFDLGDDIYEYHRMTTGGPQKDEQFHILKKMGFKIPKIGTVTELYDKYLHSDAWCESGNLPPDEFYKVVVYQDQKKHCGEGKTLMTLKDAFEYYPFKFASEYIQPDLTGGVRSWRWLQIGYRPFLLEYKSNDSWRSNCGDVDVQVIQESLIHNFVDSVEHPLWAIDFLVMPDMERIAIDFNIAPGIKWSGVDNILEPKVVADTIKETIEYFQKKNEKMHDDNI